MSEPRPPSSETPSPTRELLRRWSAGDHAAIGDLFARHYDWLTRQASKHIGKFLELRDDPTDFAQETILEFLRFMPRAFRPNEAQFRALLLKMLKNKIADRVDYYRALRRDRGTERAISSDSKLALDPPRQPVTSPSEACVRDSEAAWVRLGVELLSADARKVIQLRDYDGLSFPVVAARLGIQETATRMRYMRAVARLTAKLVKLRERGDVEDFLTGT